MSRGSRSFYFILFDSFFCVHHKFDCWHINLVFDAVLFLIFFFVRLFYLLFNFQYHRIGMRIFHYILRCFSCECLCFFVLFICFSPLFRSFGVIRFSCVTNLAWSMAATDIVYMQWHNQSNFHFMSPSWYPYHFFVYLLFARLPFVVLLFLSANLSS